MVFLAFAVSLSSENLLGNAYMCSPSAEFVVRECHRIYEEERYEFGYDYCCIYARFRECLRERLPITCRRSIQQMVDAKIGINRPRDCLGVYFPSVRCWIFYNLWIIIIIVVAILLVILGTIVICCFRCCNRMYPADRK